MILRVRLAFALLLMVCAPGAGAHTMMMTQVLVSFAQPNQVDIKIDVDLTLLLGSPERYYALATETPEKQRAEVRQLVPKLLDNLRFFVGPQQLQLVFRDFRASTAQKSDYLDASQSKLSTFTFVAALPASTAPLKLTVPIGAEVDYPVAYTVQIPAARLSITRWIEEGVHESDAFAWAGRVPAGGASSVAGAAGQGAGGPAGGGVGSPSGGAGSGATTADARFDPESLPWTQQLTLYLRLGFHHIVPEGADHILFVLGLFFLGITWRKLLSQTTVFTIAHATTLFLSTYGIFRLPSRFVEPAIALSIAYIAVENVFKPRLGPSRLAIVFAFGLVHGLGFASSLSDVPFPKRDFVVALLGFNFGVDFGQLFVIGVAFLLVGWFRNRPWFRGRIAIPCSLLIAAVGLFWAVQRIVYYSTTG